MGTSSAENSVSFQHTCPLGTADIGAAHPLCGRPQRCGVCSSNPGPTLSMTGATPQVVTTTDVPRRVPVAPGGRLNDPQMRPTSTAEFQRAQGFKLKTCDPNKRQANCSLKPRYLEAGLAEQREHGHAQSAAGPPRRNPPGAKGNDHWEKRPRRRRWTAGGVQRRRERSDKSPRETLQQKGRDAAGPLAEAKPERKGPGRRGQGSDLTLGLGGQGGRPRGGRRCLSGGLCG